MSCRLAGGDDGDVLFVDLARREVFVQRFGDGIGVFIPRDVGLEDPYLAVVAVDEDDDLAVCLALKLEGVETGELEQRSEITAGVAVVGLFREG